MIDLNFLRVEAHSKRRHFPAQTILNVLLKKEQFKLDTASTNFQVSLAKDGLIKMLTKNKTEFKSVRKSCGQVPKWLQFS